MNLKDLLTSEGRLQWRIRRATKTLLERYAQSDARMDAAHKLRAMGTPEALYGLARRFSATANNLGIDQEEKRVVRDMLVEFGERAVEPLRRYLRSYDEVTWAIDTLRSLEPPDKVISFLLEILHGGDPVHIRGDKATQILKALESLKSPEVVAGVIPCLRSPDDTVRFAAVECLEAHADLRAREPLLDAMVDPEEDSARVKARIAEAFERLGWDVKGYRKKVEESLSEPFRLSSRGRITR